MAANKRQVTLPCPSCGRLLLLPEGQYAALSQCPACGEVFTPGRPADLPPPSAQTESDPDTRYTDEVPVASETHVQRRRRGKRRRPASEPFAPLVTRPAKIAFVVSTLLFALLKLLDPPGHHAVAVDLLMAPIAGIAVAGLVLVIQGLFWKGEHRLRRTRRLRIYAVVGFLIGVTALCGVAVAAFLFGENKPRWSEIGEVLLAAPFVGLLGAALAWLVAAVVFGIRQVPTLLALAAEPEQRDPSRSDSTTAVVTNASEHVRAGDPAPRGSADADSPTGI